MSLKRCYIYSTFEILTCTIILLFYKMKTVHKTIFICLLKNCYFYYVICLLCICLLVKQFNLKYIK